MVMDKTMLYERLTPRLKAAALIDVVGLVYLPLAAIALRTEHLLATILWILFAIMLWYSAMTTVSIVNRTRRPMLTLSHDGFEFRSVSVPWKFVSEIHLVERRGRPYVDVELKEGACGYLEDQLKNRAFHRVAFRRFICKLWRNSDTAS